MCSGSGTLGLPYALKLGGWIGVGVLVLSLLVSTHLLIGRKTVDTVIVQAPHK